MTKVNSKITAILRIRGYYNMPQLIVQFETHIWGLMEANMGSIFHATSCLLAKIDRAQNRFLRELGISVDQALLELNFASTQIRQTIHILGLLHKRVLGKCPSNYHLLLPWCSSCFAEPRGRGHDKQLYGHNVEITHCQGLWDQSIVAMIDIYDDLPQHVVDALSVKIF